MWLFKLLVLAFLSVESLANGQNDYYSVAEKKEGSKYCGRNLADALRLVCGGLYNSMFNKKSDPGNFHSDGKVYSNFFKIIYLLLKIFNLKNIYFEVNAFHWSYIKQKFSAKYLKIK